MTTLNHSGKESSGANHAGASTTFVQIAGTAITHNPETMVHTLTHPETDKERIVADFSSNHEKRLTAFYYSVFREDLFALFGRAAEYARDHQVSAEFLRSYLGEIEEIIKLLYPTLDKAKNPRLFEAR